MDKLCVASKDLLLILGEPSFEAVLAMILGRLDRLNPPFDADGRPNSRLDSLERGDLLRGLRDLAYGDADWDEAANDYAENFKVDVLASYVCGLHEAEKRATTPVHAGMKVCSGRGVRRIKPCRSCLS
jgi:hypothetical protein